MNSVGPLARSVDRIVGGLSRLLHVRAAEHNTAHELDLYVGMPPSVLLPTPPVPIDVRRKPLLQPLRMRRDRVLEVLRWRSPHVPLSVPYRVRHAREYRRNQTAIARWMHPRSEPRRKALVYVHGWLEPGPYIEEIIFLPRLYDALGVDVVHLQLPFHGSRKPRGSLFHGEFFLTADLVRSFEALRQSCIDARSLMAWLRGQGYTEVGMTGLSLGASITMLAACVEQPPDYVIPVVGHLRLAEAVENAPIFWRMKHDLEGFGIHREERRAIFEGLGLHTLRPLVPPDRQMWIMARDDEYVLASLVEKQWREWGEPQIDWLPSGHMTFPLLIGRIVEDMRSFYAGLCAPNAERV
jgi:dienelactone hydrolase